MHSLLGSVKLGSLGVWPRVFGLVAGACLASAATGCIIVDDDDDYDNGQVIDPRPPEQDPMLVAIETDVELDSVPGDGVGVFVEYYPGGTYRVWTTCDTNFSGLACPMDIYMSIDSSSTFGAVSSVDLEGSDYVNLDESNGIVDLHVETSVDFDGVDIDVTPGAILRMEVLVDGIPQPRFVYWFGNGVLHKGAPTSPVDFAPTTP
jgi:hypothetical protein